MIGSILKVFTRQKNVDSVLDPEKGHLAKIGKFIGNQQFTEQERAEANAGLAAAVREFAIATANENTERSLSRRAIAGDWIRVQLFLVILSATLRILNMDQFLDIWNIAKSDLMFWGTAAVMAFHFGTYGIGAHITGKKK